MKPEPAPSAKARTYLDYACVTLTLAVEAPPRWLAMTGFPVEKYSFFFERGMLCIECKTSGHIIEVPPTQIRVCRRKKAEEAPAP